MSSAERRVVLVLGPGRSGTSTVAGLLAHSGFSVPDAVAPEESNPVGFFEPEWVMRFHTELLERAGVRTLDADPEALAAMASALQDGTVRGRLRDWLAESLEQHDRLVVKDPRLAWFHDLWTGVTAELGEEPGFVLMLRHPSEVASSRAEFYQSREISAVAGWVNVALMTERLTRGSARALVHYSRLTTDWRTEAVRLRDRLGLRLEPGPEVSPHPVDEFIDPTLRRREPGWGDSSVPAHLRDLADATFDALGDVADHGDSSGSAERLDELGRAYDAMHAAALDLVRNHVVRDQRRAVERARQRVRKRMRAADRAPRHTPSSQRERSS
ncbi:sulfotransferase family protein [Nocardioides cynanchi]|uniref:sulfotransferase family protein n=1 Tax=Nocardioides cynanchi TaxID=2558918 RepID=UPI00124821B2|nr:sulfotransferase [Nocardioides cynanchi]